MRNKWLYVFYFLLFITFTTYAQNDGNLNDTLPALAKEYIQSGHYEKADSLIQQLTIRNKKKPSSTQHVLIQILEADLERAKGNHDKGIKSLQNILINRVEKDAIKAEYYYLKSKLAEDNNDAKRYVKKGIRLKKNIPLKGLTDLSGFYNALGVYYRGLYEIDSAKHYYNKAIETALDLEGKSHIHEDIALFYQNLALPFAMQQDYEIAKTHLFKSISILNRINKDKTNDLSRNYLNLGRLYVLTGNLDSATYYYKETEKIRKKNKQKAGAKLANIYLNLGELFTTKSNMTKARMYFQKAKKLYEEADTRRNQKLQQINLNLGFTYRNQEEYYKAIDYFTKALQSSNIITLGKAYRNMADCYFELERPDSADYYFKQAIKQFRSKKKRGRYDLGLTYIYYGNFLIDQGDDQALTYLKKGRNTLTKIFGDFHRDVSRANTYIAKYYFQKQNYDKALAHAQKAIISSVNDFEEQNPRVNPTVDKLSNKSHLITAISLKGQIFFQRGKEKQNTDDLETSFATFKTAIELIDRIRLNYTYESSKLSITERSKEEFNWILKVLKKLHDQTNDRQYLTEIFRYMEKSKAAVLLSSITESKAKITANLPDSVIEKEKWLRTRINGFKNLVYQERQKKTANRNKKKIDEWESIIFRHQQQYDSLTDYIKENYNQYYKLRMEPSILKLDQIVNQLEEDDILLEYSILEEDIIIFAATKEKQTFRVVEFPKVKINELITVMRNNLQVEEFLNFNKNSYRQYTEASHQLFKKLLKPVWDMTKGKDIVVVPDGMLGYIPFELFLTDSVNTESLSDQMDYNNLPYLLKKRPISYAYSSTLLFSAIKKKSPDHRRVLAMAPSYKNLSRTPVDSLFSNRESGEFLLPIPGINKEVKNISNTYQSTVFQDTLATEKAFKREAPDYSVLHLAMHAIVDDENPMYSKLVFYQNSTNKNQGLLNTYELFELSLSAEMAVLSACNTGYGKLQRGEGIMSLARGFLYAGVPNVVMTLWPIEDESTSKIMNLFYKELAKGKEKDEALRQAKLRFLENTDMLNAHPHFWGSFVTIGPDTPIKDVNKKTDKIYWIGGILLIIAAAWIIIRRFK